VLARVTVGWLRLERLGDPGGALASFDAYLAASPDGTLAEESLVGRALALMQLGRAVEERAAWETLLARFPDSANAGRARRRLAELP
jgi:TolA-binding protein